MKNIPDAAIVDLERRVDHRRKIQKFYYIV